MKRWRHRFRHDTHDRKGGVGKNTKGFPDHKSRTERVDYRKSSGCQRYQPSGWPPEWSGRHIYFVRIEVKVMLSMRDLDEGVW